MKYILLLYIMRGEQQLKKKRIQKRGSQVVPVGELGFKAKVYLGVETEYTRRRVRYKVAKYGAQNSKECFMGRLRFTLDVTVLTAEQLQNLASFKGIKKQEWSKVRHIVYHSKDELSCAICLQQRFQAAQMTNCGHVFCWHCIVMHHYKSLKANHCPVCNQIYQLQNLVTCEPIYTKAFGELKENRINFALKARREGDGRIYDPETLEEDLNFGRIVKALPEKILGIYRQELREIQQNAKKCQDEQIKKWMEKVHALCWQKIDRIQSSKQKRQHKLHRKEYLSNQTIHTMLDEKEKNSLISFYQQKGGRLIFLHPICEKYLRKSVNNLPRQINEEIIYWQQAEYNTDLLKKYKNIAHLTINQQIDLIIIDMERLVEPAILAEFQGEMKNFREKKKQELQRQEKQAEKLSAKYSQQKQYLAMLRRLEESQFYDIKVPVTIDPSQIGDTAFFPSLIQHHSTPEHQNLIPTEFAAIKEKEADVKPTKKIIHEGDFPQLYQQRILIPSQQVQEQLPQRLAYAKSQQVSSTPMVAVVKQNDFPVLEQVKKQQNIQPGKRKKKKQKFVNVTDLFFKQTEQDSFL